MTDRVGYLIVGPIGHGVVEVATATAGEYALHIPTVADLPPAVLETADVVHLHYTDRLFGTTVEKATVAFLDLVRQLDRPFTVSLHDLPLSGHEPSWRNRRETAYREIGLAAAGIVVSSQHEACQVHVDAPLAILPLPIDRLPEPPHPPPATSEVGVLGWIYPGKGHAEVLAVLPPGMGLAALGGVSPGHDDLLIKLRHLGGRRLRVTGYLDDDALTAELRRVAVPVAPNSLISASASVGRWLGAGRRPLVADGPWARELQARCPGTLRLYAPGGLGAAIEEARLRPQSTWLGETPVGPSTEEVTRRLADFAVSVL